MATPSFFFFNSIVMYSTKLCCLLQDKDKDKEFKVDWRRAGITSSFGFAFVGPVGHYWLVPCISVCRVTIYVPFYGFISS
jgi:hypothetical protein